MTWLTPPGGARLCARRAGRITEVTGVLLVGGASRRFGSPKALAELEGSSLAELAWRTLGELCEERVAVGKHGELELPFAIVDDGGDAAVPPTGPLPGAYERTALPVLERRLRVGELSLRGALDELETRVVELDSLQLLNVNTPADLELARRRLRAGRG